MLMFAKCYTEGSPLQFGESASTKWRKLLNHMLWVIQIMGSNHVWHVPRPQELN